MSIKINSLELENIKRIKAVKIEPTPNGMTIVGGKNNQGKTSVLDAIAWALGGDSFAPSNPQNDDSVLPPSLKITLSNGLIVERKGKNGSLKITDPSGAKSGQTLLNSFIEKLALNLPKFIETNNKEKARILLNIIGLEKEINELEHKEQELYNNRHAIGVIADQKRKFADEQESYDDVPEYLISPSELIKQQQEILAKNGENERLRQKAHQVRDQRNVIFEKVNILSEELEKYKKQLQEKEKELEIAYRDSENLKDESTLELEENIRNIEEINAKIRKNLDKQKAEEEAKEYKEKYEKMTEELNYIRKSKFDLLNNASLPLKELSIENGELTYKNQKWDGMSSSQQLKVATAIIKKINPECGFVLMDKLEQMDLDSLNEFGQWLSEQGLQVIATRVSTGEECSVIIEDGFVKEEKNNQENFKKWNGGF